MSFRIRNTVPTPGARRVENPHGGNSVPVAKPVLVFDRASNTQYLVNAGHLAEVVAAEQRARKPRRSQFRKIQRGA